MARKMFLFPPNPGPSLRLCYSPHTSTHPTLQYSPHYSTHPTRFSTILPITPHTLQYSPHNSRHSAIFSTILPKIPHTLQYASHNSAHSTEKQRLIAYLIKQTQKVILPNSSNGYRNTVIQLTSSAHGRFRTVLLSAAASDAAAALQFITGGTIRNSIHLLYACCHLNAFCYSSN